VQRKDWLVLDLETTGLDLQAEPVEIGIVDHSGEVIVNVLVRSIRPPDRSAMRVHHIDPTALETAPRFVEVFPNLRRALTHKIVVAYNAQFDRRVLEYSCYLSNLSALESRWECAMTRYEEWRGFRASLLTVSHIEELEVFSHHRAVTDALLVRRLLLKMASTPPMS